MRDIRRPILFDTSPPGYIRSLSRQDHSASYDPEMTAYTPPPPHTHTNTLTGSPGER